MQFDPSTLIKYDTATKRLMKINIAQLAKNSKPLRDLLVPWSVVKKQSTAIYKQNSQSIIHMIDLTMIVFLPNNDTKSTLFKCYISCGIKDFALHYPAGFTRCPTLVSPP